MQRHLENISPNQQDQREEEDNGEAGVQHHCEIVEKDQEVLERRELEEQMMTKIVLFCLFNLCNLCCFVNL